VSQEGSLGIVGVHTRSAGDGIVAIQPAEKLYRIRSKHEGLGGEI
jgi:nitrogen regulatory protein PII